MGICVVSNLSSELFHFIQLSNKSIESYHPILIFVANVLGLVILLQPKTD